MNNRLYRIGFVVEQVLGHITHGQNLQKSVLNDEAIEACWVLPIWGPPGLIGKVPNWTLRSGLQARRALRKFQNQAKLDVLFFHTQVTAVLSQNWMKRVPTVVSIDATPRQIDELGEFYDHGKRSGRIENWKRRLDQNCFRVAEHLVTWSAWAKQSLITDYGVSADKITVIPPGVNTQEWQRPYSQKPHYDSVKILFVGGDLERKGGLVLLDAFRRIRMMYNSSEGKENSTQVELHLVTRTKVPEESGVFVYHKLQPNSELLKQLYFTSDIFCLPTFADSFGIALVEAEAVGLPIVSTDQAAVPEIVLEGKTGFLVAPGDVVALVESLKRLVENPELRLEMGVAATEWSKKCFDAQNNTRRLLELLKQTANGQVIG